MVVVRQSREGLERLREIRDRALIDDTLAFFRRYPDGYVDFSGASGDYDFYLYRNGQIVLRLGIRAPLPSFPGEAQVKQGCRLW